jgi:translation initiation factor 4A
MQGLDVIQQAQSGTGKTATFCAGILNNLDYNLQECQGLVLAPTRELAQQIEKVMRALGDYLQVIDGGKHVKCSHMICQQAESAGATA